MNLKQTMIRSFAAVSAGAVPLVLSALPASADESYGGGQVLSHRFTRENGQAVTCTIQGYSSLYRASGQRGFFATASTASDGEDPACGSAFVNVFVTYRDVNGYTKSSGASALSGFVIWDADDASRELSVEHFVGFSDCRSSCEVAFQSRPK
jgi:hypothetical protein